MSQAFVKVLIFDLLFIVMAIQGKSNTLIFSDIMYLRLFCLLNLEAY